MYILAFTDYHNQHHLYPELTKLAKKADLIICAGDPTVFSSGMQATLKRFNGWKKPLLMIHGNHEEEEDLKQACKEFQHIDFCHGLQQNIKGITFLAWGGGGFHTHDPRLAKKIKLWSKTSTPRIIITHAPPYGHLDKVHGHVGCKTITKAIDELKPDLLICGHLHEHSGKTTKRGKTTIINPGPKGMLIDFS